MLKFFLYRISDKQCGHFIYQNFILFTHHLFYTVGLITLVVPPILLTIYFVGLITLVVFLFSIVHEIGFLFLNQSILNPITEFLSKK